MSAMLNSYLGFGEVAGLESSKNDDSPLQAIPASWYTSQEMFELERRAIFSRKWLLTAHKLRLPNTGDYLRYDIAGYGFILVRDREGNINAFHNVCRHRAFPVVTDDKGTSRIFSCKYHGWSYGLNGKLAKAPGYQDLEDFDKSKNGLLPIHVHIDANGFIWVNLDSAPKPEISWEDDFKGIDLQSRFQDFNSEDYQFDHTWETEGDFNWKILADSYTENYHQRGNTDVSSLADIGAFDSKDSTDYANATPEQVANGLKISSTYYFPNASMTVSPHFFFMQRFVPTSPTKCVMRYEVYRNKHSSDADFELINQVYKRIMSEDKDLCAEAQKNLGSNKLPSSTEEGALYFQSVIRDILTGYHAREEAAGKEVWPSRQPVPEGALTTQEDIDFCTKLEAQSRANKGSDCSSQPGGCCGGGACGAAANDGTSANETMVC
ncbi:ISP domain-containing protein [Penicillium cinerascens]|uniref:Choline monooxygenase, chloroplastic n=1 Tax=Penicillium cinerascens TaxID=70096 RepID=A0A9W9SY27_9EURO|nr:ISP domain-containing protein [Penicillium cinerascens]KAJ5202115.1 ISP domain-containing protein [Penicillium cinerascens]